MHRTDCLFTPWPSCEDQIDEFGPVTAGIFAERCGSDFGNGSEIAAAPMLAAAQDHAKAGDRGGELQVGRSRVKRMAAVFQRIFEQLAGVAVGLFVAEFEGQQLAVGGCSVQSSRF